MILGIDGRLANADHPAGAGHYCREVLRTLGTMEITLRVYLDRAPTPEFPACGDDIRVLPARPFWTQRELGRELRKNPPDVFFTPVPQLPNRCPCPTLVSMLDLAVRTHPAYFPWRKRLGMRLKMDQALRRGDHFIAISESTAGDLARYHEVDRNRITVAPLGVSATFFDAASTRPHRAGLPERYILYVGQIQPRKNLVRLITAFGQVCERHPDIPHHLVLAGAEGWQAAETLRALEASPVAHRIHRLGYVPETELPGLMAGADVLALVSLSEGFGLPALEAMAAGTAVLASDCSSLPEVVGDGGLLVDPSDTDAIADGLTRLLLEEGLATRCAAAGQIRAREFTWERTAATILDVAKKLARPTSDRNV